MALWTAWESVPIMPSGGIAHTGLTAHRCLRGEWQVCGAPDPARVCHPLRYLAGPGRWWMIARTSRWGDVTPCLFPTSPTQGTTTSACGMRPTSLSACPLCLSTLRHPTTSPMTTRVRNWGVPRMGGGSPDWGCRGCCSWWEADSQGCQFPETLACCCLPPTPRLCCRLDQPNQACEPHGPTDQAAGRPHRGLRGEPTWPRGLAGCPHPSPYSDGLSQGCC